MKNLLMLALLGALIYGGYRLFEYVSGGAIDRTTKEVGGEQLRRGRRMTRLTSKKMEDVKVQNVRDAVSAFRTMHDRNPENLDELVDEGYLGSHPKGVTYDPEPGEGAAG